MVSPRAEGVLPDLDGVLRDALRGYQPGGIGVCFVDPTMIVSLPIPDWYHYAWFEDATITLTAGQSAIASGFTVPANERAYLLNVHTLRTSGDNDVNSLELLYPEGYASGSTRRVSIASLTSAGGRLYWPDNAGRQTLDYIMGQGPILMEAGTQVRFVPEGVGVAATVFGFLVTMTRQKTHRVLAP